MKPFFEPSETNELYANNQSTPTDRSLLPFFGRFRVLARGTEIYGSKPIGPCDSLNFLTVVLRYL
jgi:hypothetical protein